jgi:hypothetical protein
VIDGSACASAPQTTDSAFAHALPSIAVAAEGGTQPRCLAEASFKIFMPSCGTALDQEVDDGFLGPVAVGVSRCPADEPAVVSVVLQVHVNVRVAAHAAVFEL